MNQSKVPSQPTREILFSDLDTGWGREMPVTLLTYPDGRQDLHRQTGADFESAIAKACDMLALQGKTVGKVEFIGPTGAYMPVKPTAVAVPSESEESLELLAA